MTEQEHQVEEQALGSAASKALSEMFGPPSEASLLKAARDDLDLTLFFSVLHEALNLEKWKETLKDYIIMSRPGHLQEDEKETAAIDTIEYFYNTVAEVENYLGSLATMLKETPYFLGEGHTAEADQTARDNLARLTVSREQMANALAEIQKTFFPVLTAYAFEFQVKKTLPAEHRDVKINLDKEAIGSVVGKLLTLREDIVGPVVEEPVPAAGRVVNKSKALTLYNGPKTYAERFGGDKSVDEMLQAARADRAFHGLFKMLKLINTLAKCSDEAVDDHLPENLSEDEADSLLELADDMTEDPYFANTESIQYMIEWDHGPFGHAETSIQLVMRNLKQLQEDWNELGMLVQNTVLVDGMKMLIEKVEGIHHFDLNQTFSDMLDLAKKITEQHEQERGGGQGFGGRG